MSLAHTLRVLTLALTLTGAAMTLPGCGEDPVCEENYVQLKAGMALHEVEQIMGGAGEKEQMPTGMSISGAGIAGASTNNVDRYIWKSRGAQISVEVRDGKVASVGRSGF